MLIKENDIVLFQGDSVSDCGRTYENPDSMGYGYPIRAAGEFNFLYPELNVKFYNRGISGNRSIDLVNRWQDDCIDLEPTVVSILIGINDTWRRFDSNDPTSVEAFEVNYRKILEDVKNKLGARIIIMEPYVLPYPEDRLTWREDLNGKIAVCRKLANEYNATYVPLDGLFAAAYSKKKGLWWSPDGVHPSDTGHALITDAWLRAVGAK